jgi:lincosamide nucleotidyltransferase A/C/D/E
MLADQLKALYVDMEAHGVRLWLMGGWGVDALLGRQTRPHHDVDVLVEVAGLEGFRERLDQLGFEFKYLWDDETWWVSDASWSRTEEQPTAFVWGHPDGREIDVHVLRLDDDGGVSTLWTCPYRFSTDDLEGRGMIGGHPVRCLTPEAQLAAHTGYELPPHHLADLRLLAEARTL